MKINLCAQKQVTIFIRDTKIRFSISTSPPTRKTFFLTYSTFYDLLNGIKTNRVGGDVNGNTPFPGCSGSASYGLTIFLSLHPFKNNSPIFVLII